MWEFNKLRRLLQQKRDIKIELCVRLSVCDYFMLVTLSKIGEVYFACLALMDLVLRPRIKDLQQWARVVVRTSNVKISRRHLANYVTKLHQSAFRTCSTIIFPRSTNQIIIDLWRCRCCRHFLKSLLGSLRNDNENGNGKTTNQ